MANSLPPGKEPRKRLDWRNLAVAVLVPAAFFLALEIVLAVAGVEPVLYDEDPYVGFAGNVPLFVPGTDPDWLETAANKLRLFNAQKFPRQKRDGTYRIFCLGGSTTHGRPYDDRTSFCGWLREYLPVVDPSRRWEVINAGGVSYASYRSALLMEELVAYEPDLFIIYSGHNEFLEERTYSGLISMPEPVRGLASVLARTRVYTALRRALRLAKGSASQPRAERSELAGEVTTRLDASIGPDAYQRDDELRDRVLEHYRFNLARMVDIARSTGAEAVLVTPASNLRHCSPFKSEAGEALSPEQAQRSRDLYRQAAEALATDALEEALTAIEQAVTLDDRNAAAHYLRGRVLDRSGRHGAARTAFEQARDEDVCPLRALGTAAERVREVSRERSVPLLDFATWIDRQATDGIPGDDLFLDHVHPTIETHRQLALAMLATLRQAKVLPATATWDGTTLAAATHRVEAGLDRAAHGRALLNLSKVLGWAGKLEDAGRLARRAAETAPELPETHYQAGLTAQLVDDLDAAIEHYRRALELSPDVATLHGNLAAALEKRGKRLQAILHYRQAVELLGPEESPYKQQLIDTLKRLGATP